MTHTPEEYTLALFGLAMMLISAYYLGKHRREDRDTTRILDLEDELHEFRGLAKNAHAVTEFCERSGTEVKPLMKRMAQMHKAKT